MRWTYKLYVTYVPTDMIEKKVMKKRAKLLSDGKMTGHDVRRSTVNQLRTYGRDLSQFKKVKSNIGRYDPKQLL